MSAEAAAIILPEERTRQSGTVQLPAVHSGAAAFINMIADVARDPRADVTKIMQLYELRNLEMAREAEAAFDEAMTAAQAEMQPVRADADNDQTHSKYASYAALDNAIRPIYTRHGFAISYNTAESKKPEHILMLGYVTAKGHKRTYQIDMPNDGKGAKGGDVMTKTHATGGAASYGMRYLLKMIFNIAVGESDRDGNDVVDRFSDEQVAKVDKLIIEVGANKKALMTYLKVERLADIPAARFDAVVRAVEAKRKAPAGKTGGARK